MVEAWRSGGVPLLDSTGLARVFITSLLLFAIAICLLKQKTADRRSLGPAGTLLRAPGATAPSLRLYCTSK